MSVPLSLAACDRLTALAPAVELGGYRFRTLRWGSDRGKTVVQPRHHHAFCEIILLHAGEIRSECEELLHAAPAPAVLVTMPGERHRHGQGGAVDMDWWGLSVERRRSAAPDGLEELVAAWIARRLPAATCAARVLATVAALESELTACASGWRRAVAWTLQQLLLDVIRATAIDTPADPAEDLPAALREAVRARPDADWSVADLAALVGVGERQLGRLLRRHAGCSPLALVTAERMALAEALLLADGATVAAVAAQLGYRDQRHFARLFKRHRGVPPAGWRAAAAAYRVEE